MSAVAENLKALGVLTRAGIVRPKDPRHLVRAISRSRAWGPLVAGVLVAAEENPTRPAVVDEAGSVSYAELNGRSDVLAHGLRGVGLTSGSTVGLLMRDHRGIPQAVLAAGKLGAHAVLMNTGSGPAQLAAVARRESVDVMVFDQEFVATTRELPRAVRRVIGWVEDPTNIAVGVPTMEQLLDDGLDRGPLAPPPQIGRIVLLTSGTTGIPKGAPRADRSPMVVAQLLDRLPFPRGGSTLVASPTFHATGFAFMGIMFGLQSTVVLRRRFDPEQTLATLVQQHCTGLVLVPTMLKRILDLGPAVLSHYDTSALQVLLCSGSALAPDLGSRAMEAFGEVLFNVYGSTEAAVATVAKPEDWRAAPGTVGRPPCGVKVRLYDERGHAIEKPGHAGRIYVGNNSKIESYTDGSSKPTIDGLMATGDTGHFDSEGRLHVDGRDDDMIISGGENVSPVEIENLLVAHPGIAEAAVLGTPDDDFGHRLRAFVVLTGSQSLDAEDVRRYVKENLARHKVPRDVVFLERLPRNATDKVLRRELAKM